MKTYYKHDFNMSNSIMNTKLTIYLDKENKQFSNGTIINNKECTQISKPYDDGEAQLTAFEA